MHLQGACPVMPGRYKKLDKIEVICYNKKNERELKTLKGRKIMMKKIYHKTMRRLARFVHGFDRCPIDCKKDFKGQILKVFDLFIGSIVFFVVIGFIMVALV